jgi:hypothetical protein
MKSLLIFWFILIMIQLQLKAQDGFVVETSGQHEFNIPVDVVVKPDGNMIFGFISVPETSTTYENVLCEVNPAGDILNTFNYSDTLHDYVEYTHILYVEDTLFVFGWGYKYLQGSRDKMFLLMQKFDAQLELISTRQIWLDQLTQYGVLHGRLKYFNNRFFYVNSYGPGTIVAPFYVEISRNGDLISFGSEPLQGYNRVPYDFIIHPDDSKFKVFTLTGLKPGTSGFEGMIVNYNGNFEIEESYTLPYNYVGFFTYQPIDNSVYYLAGKWYFDDYPTQNIYRTGILKIENDTVILNAFNYAAPNDSAAVPAYRNSIEILPDGNVIHCFTGDLRFEMFPQLQPAKINLMKLTPDLEVIWHRYIGASGFKYDAYYMRVTENDEIVINAAVSPAPWEIFWDMNVLFIKTNSDGLITNITDAMPSITSTETLLYPNPAQEQVVVEFSLAYSRAWLEISNMNGQQVLAARLTENAQQVDISALPAGSYIYRIYNSAGLNESGKLIVNK